MVKRYAQINGGVVRNVAVAESTDAATLTALAVGSQYFVDLTSTPLVGVNWTYNGVTFSAPPSAAASAEPVVVVSPDGTRWVVTIGNDGTPTTSPL